MKKILCIGGSYFVGRVFNILASRSGEFAITVVNRGRYELKLDNVTQIHFDRHDTAKLALLPKTEFDAVIDFCAYESGDIRSFLQNMPCSTRQYIYISTCSVYDPYAPAPVTESSPVASRFGTDANSAYVEKKLNLEYELKEACAKKGCAWTILRPAFIFGPFNYAPREPLYFQNILKGAAIPHPTDAKAKFQFIYVKDIAAALMAAVGNEKAYNEVFNLSAPEQLDYDGFLAELERANGGKVATIPMTCAEIAEKQILLPYPTQYDELYSGEKVEHVLGIKYTPYGKAFKETYDIYMNAFRG